MENNSGIGGGKMIEAKPKSKLHDFSKPPQILLNYVRDEKGNIAGVRHMDLRAGSIIKRCGKIYRIDKNGTQRRVR